MEDKNLNQIAKDQKNPKQETQTAENSAITESTQANTEAEVTPEVPEVENQAHAQEELESKTAIEITEEKVETKEKVVEAKEEIIDAIDEVVDETEDVVEATLDIVDETIIEVPVAITSEIIETESTEKVEEETIITQNETEIEVKEVITEIKEEEALGSNNKQKEELHKLDKDQEDIDKIADNVSHDDDDDDDIATHNEVETEDTIVYEDLSLDELVAMMEDLVKVENIATIKNKVLKVNIAYQAKYKTFKEEHKKNFIAEGGNEDQYKFDDGGIHGRFNQSFRIYKQKRFEYNEAQELLKQENLKQKEVILEELRGLIDSEESLKKIYDEFKNLQEKWRQIGMVPKNDASNLWMNYNFLVDKFFEKVQIDRELRDIGFKKNLETKIELAEKTEELLLEKSFTKSFKLLQDYHRQWKETGPVPHDKSDEIWERFKSASEKVNNRRREYYLNMSEEQNNNLILKNELIEKAETLTSVDYNSINEWNKKTKELDLLMEEWKKIGPAPKAHNDEIWKRFKACFSNFYKLKRQYFNALNEQQMENYQAKLDICKTAEALQTSTDWNKSTNELKRLQQEWKKIGQVPYKHSDKIWKRFRAACDTFFNAKEEFYKHLKDHEKENLDKKKALIETIKTTVFDEDKDKAFNEMKEFQKQWIEIGQVPYKDKDKINKDYRQIVDEKLSEIGLSAVDVELSRIKERASGGKEQENESRYLLQREIGSIRMKIEKIRSEIGTWENNIGFFAKSKNADVLKGEFQTKIDAGNKKIESLEARMRLLDKTMRSLSAE